MHLYLEQSMHMHPENPKCYRHSNRLSVMEITVFGSDCLTYSLVYALISAANDAGRLRAVYKKKKKKRFDMLVGQNRF